MDSNTSTLCSHCNSTVAFDSVFCNNCGYPVNGTDQERDLFNFRIKLKKDTIDEANKKLKNVRVMLYIVAGINVIAGLIYFFQGMTVEVIASLIGMVVYVGCAYWVSKQPLTGVIAAFIFWILIQLLAALGDPATLIHGLLWKVIFISIFVKGISSAMDVKKFKTQLKEMHADLN